ncbi:MAG: type I-U CRISPR-associated protein Cas7 [Planctomycetota bacterium]|nr:MAG: type I-U CRISPR-associated protein Cas7 [Planctomycetota bacterium]
MLRNAVAGRAAAIRCRTVLQPAAGAGTKVFPPTHAGGVYATEQRRLPVEGKPGETRVVECVLLDSVQSQANRIEDALQQAIDDGRLSMPLIVVEFGDAVGDVQRVTSLQAPHRAADAILRDSLTKEKDDKGKPLPFRKSQIGDAITNSSLGNAIGLYRYCPHALFLGVWDSTGPKGGLGAKFARALVSEIVGVDAAYGVRTGSRIDPLQIAKQAGPLFRRPDGTWTLDATEAVQELDNKGKTTGKVLLYKKVGKKDVFFDPIKQAGEVPDAGKPSAANHGNVTPDLVKYDDAHPAANPLMSGTNSIRYRFQQDSDGVLIQSNAEAAEKPSIKSGQIAAGGVTISHAEHTAVLSLPQLRRLRFPLNGTLQRDSAKQREIDNAARTVLAALSLVGLTLSLERGCDLRSRCLLFPEGPLSFELLEKPGEPTPLSLDSEMALAIYEKAVGAATKLGLPWDTSPVTLTPSPELIALVKKSQELAAVGGADAEEN